MISSSSEYLYISPRCTRVDGRILPYRGKSECLVRGEDIAFLAEAVKERSESPSHQDFTPFVQRSGINNVNVSISGITGGIISLFDRFVDPTYDFGGGSWSSGEFWRAPLPEFVPYTMRVLGDTYRNDDRRTLDSLRAMFADISRLRRLRLSIASYRLVTSDGNTFAATWKYDAGSQSVETYSPAPCFVDVFGGLGDAVLHSDKFTASGHAIIRENVNVPGSTQNNVRWRCVQLGDHLTINPSYVSAYSVQEFAASLGWSMYSTESWNGMSYPECIVLDCTFPASFDDSGWRWHPQNN